ncbi:MAG: SCP2 sterol-binding domain-containing protein [Candidatus Thorarchaeota archaeon]|nr:SCP2 sterol-binding domain-containing protein [Candidatus Thorarchaeota archaeon]
MTDELLELMQEKLADGLEREATKDAIAGWERTALLELKNGATYHFIVKDNTITMHPGSIDKFDMKIKSDEETIRKLFLEEMSATAAIFKRKLKVKGSTSDLMKLKHIF